MKNLTNQQFYVISAEKTGLHPTVNSQHTKQLRDHLTNLGATFLEGTGAYQGTGEQIFVTFGEDDQQEALLELAALYQQDCILKVYPSREAYFLFTDGKETYQGLWTSLLGKPPKDSDYTEVDGQYFTIS